MSAGEHTVKVWRLWRWARSMRRLNRTIGEQLLPALKYAAASQAAFNRAASPDTPEQAEADE